MSTVTRPDPGAERPSLLFGVVRHQRLRPARNAFRYGVCSLRLPLRTLAARVAHGQSWGNRWFGHNRFGLLGFYDRDYGDGDGTPLQWVDALLQREGIHDAAGEIWLHTFPRVLGYVFNPVSFWFCERTDGALRAIICEVRNTFGERHCYLLETGEPLRDGTPLTAQKAFHVSPFCALDGHYEFRFMTVPAQPGKPLRTVARIDYADASGPLLLTSICGTARTLDARHTLIAFFRFPLMTVGVVAKIHWQALKLWMKRVPFLRKPEPPASSVSHQAAKPFTR